MALQYQEKITKFTKDLNSCILLNVFYTSFLYVIYIKALIFTKYQLYLNAKSSYNVIVKELLDWRLQCDLMQRSERGVEVTVLRGEGMGEGCGAGGVFCMCENHTGGRRNHKKWYGGWHWRARRPQTGEPTESMCPPVPPYSPFFSSFCAPSCHHGMLQHASASFPFDEGGW